MSLSRLGNTNAKGSAPWNKGKKVQSNTGRTHFKKGLAPWNKGKKIQSNTGRTHFKKGQVPWNWKGGKPKCPHCGKQLSTHQSKTCRHCWLKAGKPTSIEKKVYNELKARGFLFEKQKTIGNKFTVDAYIPRLNLIIECDGDYWHNLPVNVRRDASKDAYLKKCGYGILRLTGTEINNGSFKQELGALKC